jgi:hypothetical protein
MSLFGPYYQLLSTPDVMTSKVLYGHLFMVYIASHSFHGLVYILALQSEIPVG